MGDDDDVFAQFGGAARNFGGSSGTRTADLEAQIEDPSSEHRLRKSPSWRGVSRSL